MNNKKPLDFTTILDDLPNQNVSIAKQLLDNVDRPNRHNINPVNRPPRSVDPLSPRNIYHKKLITIKAIFFKRKIYSIMDKLPSFIEYELWSNEQDTNELRICLDDTQPEILEYLKLVLTEEEYQLLNETTYDYLIFWE